MNETSATIVGNVVDDLRQRRTMNGVKLVSFRVASNERRFDKESGDWANGDSLFVNVTCWRKLANGVAASLTKGDPVIVTGRIYTRSYESEGQRRFSLEMDAAAVGPDLARSSAEIQRNRALPRPEADPVLPAQPDAGVGDITRTPEVVAA